MAFWARNAAHSLLQMISSTSTPEPIIVPTQDGSVQIEWHAHGIDLEIRILSSTKVRVSFEDLRGEHEPFEGELQYDFTPLGAAIQILSNR